jgi:MYND finger/Zinc finger, C3HC4 type (RING finger)
MVQHVVKKEETKEYEKPNNNNNNNIMSVTDQIRSFSREWIKCDGGCGTSNPKNKCSKCLTMYYCSVQCQRKHWKEHKHCCVSVEEMRLDEEEKYEEKIDTVATTSAIANAEKSKDLLGKKDPKPKDVCSICLTPTMVVLDCNHGLCSSCVLQYQQRKQKLFGEIMDDVDVSKLMICQICTSENKDDIDNDNQRMEKVNQNARKAKSMRNKPRVT